MGDASTPTTDNNVVTEDPAITAQKLLKAQTEAAKARIEAETAEIARDKAAGELADTESPLSDAKREAEDRKAIDKANQEAAAARQQQVAALLPDLSKIEGGDLKVGERSPLFGPSLAKRALSSAADELAAVCIAALDAPQDEEKRENGTQKREEWRLLVTADPELATSDAVYQDVLAGIEQMSNAMAPLLTGKPSETATADRAGAQRPVVPMTAAAAPAIADVAAALAAAIPSAISLLLPRRTLSSGAISVDSTAASAAAIGALKAKKPSAKIVHDGFRLLPEGGTVLGELGKLEAARQALVGHKLALESERTRATADLSSSEEKVKTLGKAVESATGKDKASLEADLAAEKALIVEHRRAIGDAATRIGLIDSALNSVDTFLNTLRTTPTGSARSPLATALLREQLHRERGEGLTHVLLIQAEEGAAHEVLDDRRIKADRVSLVGNINISYTLIEAVTSYALASGVAGGEATLSGTIGSKLELDT